MGKKVILVLIDGLRPDAIERCKGGYGRELMRTSAYTLEARTVMPSVTLPCHMSLVLSVDPSRHGILTNTYTPQVRPIEGLFERLDGAGRRCAFFYTWEQLRDLSRPNSLNVSLLLNLNKMEGTDDAITEAALSYIRRADPDFVFLYLGLTDEAGHDHGWMSEGYLRTADNALECVRRVREGVSPEHDLILLADHGGHARNHGTDCDEDMTIPLFLNGPSFRPGRLSCSASILDIAPTIAELLEVAPGREWEGRSLAAAARGE